MKKAKLAALFAATASVVGGDQAVALGQSNCSGNDCLAITNIRHGTRCGAHDSIEFDIRNVSGSMYLLGYVEFDAAEGHWQIPTGLMKPGAVQQNIYHCHASGTPSARVNTGTDPNRLSYPSRSTPASSSRPNITAVRLNQASIDKLKSHAKQLHDAGVLNDLLAWSPLAGLVLDSNVPEVAIDIYQSNWEWLAKSFSSVGSAVFNTLANDARLTANDDRYTFGNPQAKQFWNAMADFYASQAPGLINTPKNQNAPVPH
jgi:hypothetical protein